MPATPDKALRLALLSVMRLTLCPMCGKRKAAKQCFCKTCYFALPVPLRNLLYTRLDDSDGEFEECYLKALRYLHSKGFHRPYRSWPIEAQKMIAETGLIQALASHKEAKKKVREEFTA